MKIICAKDYSDLSRKAANIISAQVILKPESVLGLATGSSPLGVYRQLILWYEKGDLDFAEATSVNLDEYRGLSANNTQSYHYFMHKNFFDYINIAPDHIHIPDGMAADPDAECRRPLLVGGGVGVPPLYNLAKKLIDKGRKVTVVLGFNTASEVFYEEEFRALSAEVFVTTADGTHGTKGFVTTAIAEKKPDFDYFYACGPLPMLRALSDATGDIPGELSFEERMGCGFGGCMGCSCQTKNGAKRICKEGPVLKKEEIIW